MAFQGPLSKIELRVSAQHLPNLDVLSKSDPQLQVFLKAKTGQSVEIGRTEVVKDNLNPAWVTPITVGMISSCNYMKKMDLLLTGRIASEGAMLMHLF